MSNTESRWVQTSPNDNWLELVNLSSQAFRTTQHYSLSTASAKADTLFGLHCIRQRILLFCVLDIFCVYVFCVDLCVQCVLCGSSKTTLWCCTSICNGIILSILDQPGWSVIKWAYVEVSFIWLRERLKDIRILIIVGGWGCANQCILCENWSQCKRIRLELGRDKLVPYKITKSWGALWQCKNFQLTLDLLLF